MSCDKLREALIRIRDDAGVDARFIARQALAASGGLSGTQSPTGEQAILDAARKHKPDTIDSLRYDCYSGDCDNDEHMEAGECPTRPVEVCSACMEIAYAINDEVVPDEVLADRCPICVAVAGAASYTEQSKP